MADPSFVRKFRRAQKHLSDLNRLVSDYVAGKPYLVAEQKDDETLRCTWTITLTQTVPDGVAEVAGDCLHNLRSVLDHWVEEFSVAQAGQPVQGAGFPVRPDELHWNPSPAGRKDDGPQAIRKLPDSVKAVIKSYQPFETDPAWKDDIRRGLLTLHKLDIRDKHKTLNVVATGYGVIGYGLPDTLSEHPRPISVFRDVLEPDTPKTLMVLEFASLHDLKVGVHLDPEIDVVLVENEANRRPVIETLELIMGNVSWVMEQMTFAFNNPGSPEPLGFYFQPPSE